MYAVHVGKSSFTTAPEGALRTARVVGGVSALAASEAGSRYLCETQMNRDIDIRYASIRRWVCLGESCGDRPIPSWRGLHEGGVLVALSERVELDASVVEGLLDRW